MIWIIGCSEIYSFPFLLAFMASYIYISNLKENCEGARLKIIKCRVTAQSCQFHPGLGSGMAAVVICSYCILFFMRRRGPRGPSWFFMPVTVIPKVRDIQLHFFWGGRGQRKSNLLQYLAGTRYKNNRKQISTRNHGVLTVKLTWIGGEGASARQSHEILGGCPLDFPNQYYCRERERERAVCVWH